MAINQPVPPGGSLGAADNSNKNGIIFESADRAAATYDSEEIHNFSAKGVDLFVNATSSGAGTVTTKIQKKDPASGTWVDLPGAVTAALADPGTALLTVYPGIAETPNVSVSDHLGLIWRVSATVAAANVTFSVGAVYLK